MLEPADYLQRNPSAQRIVVLFAEHDDVGKIRVGFRWKSEAPQRYGDVGVTYGRRAEFDRGNRRYDLGRASRERHFDDPRIIIRIPNHVGVRIIDREVVRGVFVGVPDVPERYARR